MQGRGSHRQECVVCVHVCTCACEGLCGSDQPRPGLGPSFAGRWSSRTSVPVLSRLNLRTTSDTAFFPYSGSTGALQPSPIGVRGDVPRCCWGSRLSKLSTQCSIDKANKAGLFVFCVSPEVSWQFCNNTEE